MSHIKNKGIFYIANGTDPNILGITPTSNLGLCKTQDGTKEWNYNDTLAPGSKWVLKDGGKKVYKALVTQENTEDPIAVVLENTLGGEVIWTRDFDGTYIGTLLGAFSENKVNIGTNTAKLVVVDPLEGNVVYLFWDTGSSIKILNLDNYILLGGLERDNIKNPVFIDIEVYP